MRTIVLTGASDGIGAAAAQQLSHHDEIKLIVVGRSPEKTRRIADQLKAEHHLADFTELDQVRELATALNSSCEQIDVLANNAGGLFPGPERTVDGFEKTFQVNHLAPFLLTHLLLGKLIESRASVVSTSSIGARIYGRLDMGDLNTWANFTSNRAYGNAKLANILFTKGLHERFHDAGISSVAFHPGVIATNFASDSTNYFRWVYHGLLKKLLASPAKGGERLHHFTTGTPGQTWTSGEFYGTNLKPARTNPAAYDPQVVEEHWDRSAEMLGIRD